MSATIHPTAIIDQDVELADDVVIGPYCVLEGKISIGRGTRLLNHVTVKGPLTMGEDNLVYPYVSLGHDPQDLSFNPEEPGAGTVIGDRNKFRESFCVHRATGDKPTSIGSDCMFMHISHVGHDCQIGNHVILSNSCLLGGHTVMGDHVVCAGNSGTHQFVRVGRMAMLGALVGVNQDLPPFCLALELRTIAGINRVGLRRNGLRHAIKPLERAYEMLCMRAESNTNAIKRVRQELADSPEAQEMADFVENSKRGICRHFSRHRVMMQGDSIHLLNHDPPREIKPEETS